MLQPHGQQQETVLCSMSTHLQHDKACVLTSKRWRQAKVKWSSKRTSTPSILSVKIKVTKYHICFQ